MRFLAKLVSGTLVVVALLAGLASIFAFFEPAQSLLIGIVVDPIRAEIEVSVDRATDTTTELLLALREILDLLRPVIERCLQLGDACFGQ